MSKIFGIGLSKTGTTTLNKALEILGFKSVHCPTDRTTFQELLQGKYRLSVLNDYDAITDIVVSIYYAQFDKEYPNSKFILTVRNKQDWLKSIQQHIERTLLGGKWLDYLADRKIALGPKEAVFAEVCYFLHCVTYGCPAYSESRLGFAYDNHTENVINYFSGRDDLLILDVCAGDGWEKLCKFLSKPVPNEKFPYENKTCSPIVRS